MKLLSIRRGDHVGRWFQRVVVDGLIDAGADVMDIEVGRHERVEISKKGLTIIKTNCVPHGGDNELISYVQDELTIDNAPGGRAFGYTHGFKGADSMPFVQCFDFKFVPPSVKRINAAAIVSRSWKRTINSDVKCIREISNMSNNEAIKAVHNCYQLVKKKLCVGHWSRIGGAMMKHSDFPQIGEMCSLNHDFARKIYWRCYSTAWVKSMCDNIEKWLGVKVHKRGPDGKSLRMIPHADALAFHSLFNYGIHACPQRCGHHRLLELLCMGVVPIVANGLGVDKPDPFPVDNWKTAQADGMRQLRAWIEREEKVEGLKYPDFRPYCLAYPNIEVV